MAVLATALDDAKRTRIGNPSRNSWSVSILEWHADEATKLAESLETIGVTFQTNFRRDEHVRPVAAYITIYGLDDQLRLSEVVGPELEPDRRTRLEVLVRARGPIPKETLRRMAATVEAGKSEAYVAERMTQLGLIDGMGKGWTAKKVGSAVTSFYRGGDQTAARLG